MKSVKVVTDIPEESNLMYPTSSVSKDKSKSCRDETKIKAGLATATELSSSERKRKPWSDESRTINSSKKSKLSEPPEKDEREVSNFYLITKQWHHVEVK